MRLVAFEWDSSELRVALGRQKGKAVVIDEAFGIPFIEKEEAIKPAEIGKLLGKELQARGVTKGEALVAVGRANLELRFLTAPPAPADELPDLVRFQAMRQFTTLGDDATQTTSSLNGTFSYPRVRGGWDVIWAYGMHEVTLNGYYIHGYDQPTNSPLNGVSDPITTPSATAIVRVTERQDVTDAQIAAGRDEMREEMTAQRRDRFFSAYMQKAKSGLKININTATRAELELLPGIGPSLAERIIAERDRSGPFTRIEDLGRVRGIGSKTIDRLRDHTVIE